MRCPLWHRQNSHIHIYLTLLIPAGQEKNSDFFQALLIIWCFNWPIFLRSVKWSWIFFTQENGETRWLKHQSATASPDFSSLACHSLSPDADIITFAPVIIIYHAAHLKKVLWIKSMLFKESCLFWWCTASYICLRNRAAWLMILHKLAPGTNPPYVAPLCAFHTAACSRKVGRRVLRRKRRWNRAGGGGGTRKSN